MSDTNFTNPFFLYKLKFMKISNDYMKANIKVRKNRKLIFKDNYSLVCNAGNKRLISTLLHSRARCRKLLSVDTNELRELLEINGYKNNHFKTEENAKNVADYINAHILLHSLKV